MSDNISKKHKRNFDDAANAALFIAVFIGVWQLVYTLGIFPPISLPSPAMVAETFVKIILNGTLFWSVGVTLGRLLLPLQCQLLLEHLLDLQ